MDWTSHEFCKLLYVAHGAGALRERGGVTPLGANDLVYVPSGLEHRLEDVAGSPLSLFVVCVRAEEQASSVRSALEWLTVLRQQPVHGDAASLQSTLRGMLYHQRMRPPGWDLALVGDVSRLLAALVRTAELDQRTQTKPKTAAERVKRYVDSLQHTFFLKSSMSEVAASLNLSERHFSSLFRLTTGRTWLQFVTDLRVDYAKRTLRTTHDSVTAVAFQSGFEELSTFYRAFRSRTGIAPGRWRDAVGQSAVDAPR